ncbi:hypothetical protein RCG23_24740 [Neobacillus sp. PS3-34]|uniref:hypothetical protein n=1 Tax=Neobacillus sp. PS3-34 TaxID=3070678 RepID=UPI0027DFC77B|nr:hypothetical protein [Neobacillus sp. PS3-34]WML48407.1 hypothetical protein RCG23_24740 [Neobacillus sp. PS3-34]
MTQIETKLTNQIDKKPSITNVLLIFAFTMVSATIVFPFANKIIPQWYSPLISISSHIPMLIIPWIWIRARRKNESKDIGWGKFNKKDKLSLLILCS